MCYSQQLILDFHLYMRNFGVKLSTKEFLALFQRRCELHSLMRLQRMFRGVC